MTAPCTHTPRSIRALIWSLQARNLPVGDALAISMPAALPSTRARLEDKVACEPDGEAQYLDCMSGSGSRTSESGRGSSLEEDGTGEGEGDSDPRSGTASGSQCGRTGDVGVWVLDVPRVSDLSSSPSSGTSSTMYSLAIKSTSSVRKVASSSSHTSSG
jgi:hypothetical protein